MTEKSVLEQALLQVQNLEEAVKANAKGILASTMKQELNELLKESLEEEEKDVEEQPNPEEEEDDVTADDAGDDTTSDEDETSDDEELPSDDETSDDEELPSDDEDETSYEDEPSDDSGVMDMTGASHDEVLKVFKAMKPEDGIIVKKDDDELDLEIDGDEYIIKLDGEGDEDLEEESPYTEDLSEEMDMDPELEEEMGMEPELEEEMDMDPELGEENVYEITLDEEDPTLDISEEEPFTYEEPEGSEDGTPIEATEAARTKSNPHGNKGGLDRSGLPSKKKYKAGSGVFGINEEVSKLRKQNAEYKKALVLFKEKLNEVAVFNANLAYATRLFTEHSTTKQEKLNIMKRFDSISTMNESKNLFNTIKSELGTKKPVTETVSEKITSTPSTSSSNVLSESKAYENPQFKRMKDLMSKIK